MPGPAFIDGDDVTLRTIEKEDLQYLKQVRNSPTVWRAIGRPWPVNAEQEQEFFEEVVSDDDSVQLLVCTDEQPVGTAGLQFDSGDVRSAELGYWIDPAHHENGYGSEATDLLTTYGFRQRGCHRITARVFEFNDASQGLLESLGFTLEGCQREHVFADGEYQDLLWYGVLAREWE